MSGTATAEDLKVEKQVQEQADNLMSGRYFALHAMSERSRLGYQPPITNRDYAKAIGTLAEMAAQGDRLAAVAREVIASVNLYGTDGSISAGMYEAAGAALRKGYLDVIGLAGPEPGRRSDRQHEYTLSDRIRIAIWLSKATEPFANCVPGIGWVLQLLAEREGVAV